MKFRETVIAGASGSLGGLTASHNRFGSYLRSRVVPTNPSSTFQQNVRAFFAQLAGLWQTTLTAGERLAWTVYGQNVAMTDPIGATIYLTGLNHYIRSNLPRLQAGLARVDAGPTEYNLGDFTPSDVAAAAGAGTLSVTFTDTDDWVGEDGAAMLIYGSTSKAQTINFFRGPYRVAGKIDGDATTPPTTPGSVLSANTLIEGLKVFGRLQVSRADGRLSATQNWADVLIAA